MTLVVRLKPQRQRNFQLTALIAVSLVGVYLVVRGQPPWSPGRAWGLAFGVLAALLLLLEMAYSSRRPRGWPFRTAQRWLQAHVYLGVLALVAILIHADFRWPHGGMGWWLLGLAVWATLSGVLGVLLQKSIPATLSEGLRVEAIYERIPELIDQLRKEADALVEGASEPLASLYRSHVRPMLAGPTPSWAYLLNARAGRSAALEPFERVGGNISPGERERVRDIESILIEKLELDAHYRLQGVLRQWLLLHVPPATLLVALTAVHVFTWFWY